MAASDAYAASGGWSGGSALTTGGVLSNYYQKLKTVDPTSGQLTTAQPAQASQQPSSIARVATTTPATQATTQTQQATGALPTIATVPLISLTKDAAHPTQVAGVGGPGTVAYSSSPVQAGTGVIKTTNTDTTGALGRGVQASIQIPGSYLSPAVNTLGGPVSAAVQAAGPVPTYSGPLTKNIQVGNYMVQVRWNNITKQYEYPKYGMIYDTTNPLYHSAQNTGLVAALLGQNYRPAYQPANESIVLQNNATAQAAIGTAVQQANAADDTKNAVASYQTALAAYDDKVEQNQAQIDAQNAADNTNVFSLAGQLQAPNTTAVDQAGRNDLAKIISQYNTGPSGADAAAYNFLGQSAQGTQQAVNASNHATAYANAYNANYSTFANALAAQQTADANASGQKLSNDIQGISQAVQQLTQQTAQLSGTKQTQFNSALIPIQQQLAQYQLAVKQYGVSSQQALSIAKSILGAAGSLTSVLTAVA